MLKDSRLNLTGYLLNLLTGEINQAIQDPDVKFLLGRLPGVKIKLDEVLQAKSFLNDKVTNFSNFLEKSLIDHPEIMDEALSKGPSSEVKEEMPAYSEL